MHSYYWIYNSCSPVFTIIIHNHSRQWRTQVCVLDWKYYVGRILSLVTGLSLSTLRKRTIRVVWGSSPGEFFGNFSSLSVF